MVLPLSSHLTYRWHPRSRGVYLPETFLFVTFSGSSPLARGLPGWKRPAVPARGIIPARAGFTMTTVLTPGVGEDHPRSRGVYFSDGAMRFLGEGSSPLARGLLGVPGALDSVFRIIPARAGFTRSRATAMATARGSSPLARGLPAGEYRLRRARRIIPARAGFTLAVLILPGLARDHPRSRGVYPERSVRDLAGVGSSPLARGLLVGGVVHDRVDRIIPARAGFTHGPGEPATWSLDGIIPARAGFTPQPAAPRWPTRGSSPLARGLLGL